MQSLSNEMVKTISSVMKHRACEKCLDQCKSAKLMSLLSKSELSIVMVEIKFL